MCGGSVRSILLLPLMDTIHVCIWRMLFYVCCSGCVGMFVV